MRRFVFLRFGKESRISFVQHQQSFFPEKTLVFRFGIWYDETEKTRKEKDL
jgi:hypothetical protein